jgi:hypothetical protein
VLIKESQEKSREGRAAEFADTQLRLDSSELIKLAQVSIHYFAVEVGLQIAGHLLEDDVQCHSRLA